MIEIDFAQGFFLNNTRQLGKCGLSDQHRKFHTLIYGIFMSENSEDAKMMLDLTVLLLSRYGKGTVTSMICDGSKALTKAQEDCVGIQHLLDCFAHISRPLSTRGYGKMGSRGSVARYLVSHGIHIDKIISIMFDFFAIRHLNCMEEWKTSRELFKIKFPVLSDTKYDHFWNYYFPENPRWGNVPHKAGEIHSVQGLEKSWDIDKSSIKNEKLSSKKDLELRHVFSGISNRYVYN